MKHAKTATQNACKLCNPLGACLAFRGIESCVPFLHGSQGCATYIRRYLISHYKEPIDIASSNFHEETAVFGGSHNLKIGLKNVSDQYKPQVIGVATTCLTEINVTSPTCFQEIFDQTGFDVAAMFVDALEQAVEN